MNYGSICSGIEAASQAWHPLGFECQFTAEIEPFPSAVLASRWPTFPNLGDVTQFKQWPDYAIDILVGGTPCQSFSVAGLRAGLADPRGNLALVFLGVIERYRPRWVVWENVPGVHSSWSDATETAPSEESRRLLEADGLDAGDFVEVEQTSDFDSFCAGLAELGYGIATRVLDAQHFGLAQRRERVFVVGHSGGQWQRAAAVLFDSESLRWNPPKGRETREGTAPTISARTKGGGGLGTDAEVDGALIPFAQNQRNEVRELNVAGSQSSIRRGDAKNETLLAIPIQEIGKRQSGTPMNGVGHGEPGDPMFTLQSGAVHGVCATLTKNYATHHGRSAGNNGGVAQGQLVPTVAMARNAHPGGRFDSESETLIPVIAHTVSAGRDGYNDGSDQTYVPVAFSVKDHGADAGELSPTLRAGNHDGSHANGGCGPAIAFQPRIARNGHGTPSETAHALQSTSTGKSDAAPCVASVAGVRRLTPTECERLQGFPDGYTAIPWRGKPASECPDGPRYRALGNSMAVPVMRWIGERIALIEKIA